MQEGSSSTTRSQPSLHTTGITSPQRNNSYIVAERMAGTPPACLPHIIACNSHRDHKLCCGTRQKAPAVASNLLSWQAACLAIQLAH